MTCDSLSVSEGITLSLCLLCRSQSYQACLRFMLNELEPCFQDKPGSILLWDMQTRSIHITFALMEFFSACEVHFIESIQREQPTPGIRFTDLFFLECFFFLMVLHRQGHMWTLTCVTSVSQFIFGLWQLANWAE